MAMEDSLYNGTWWETSTDQPVYEFAVPTDIAMQAVQPATVPVNDPWSGFFQSAASALVNYGIQKDAAGNRVNIQPNGYNSQQAVQQRSIQAAAPGNGLVLLLIGAAVLLAVK